MANTVTTISYANTFGQWMVATDALIGENNTLAKGDYTKDTGTIYLSETTKNALQSNGNIVVQKQLLVQGSGSSATMDNNLTVGGQVYFSNTTLGLTNSGQANINGLLIAQGPGIGLYVANNAYVGGNTTIRYNTITNTVQANSSVNTANASITGTTYTNVLQANTSTNTATASVTGTTYTDVLQANTSTNTGTASITGTTYTKVLQANTSTNTATASVTGITFTDILQANTSTNTATASIAGTTYTKVLQANTSTNTTTASVTGVTFTNVLQANTSTNTGTASITGTTYTNVLQANTSTNTGTASITGTTFTKILQANTSINTSTASVTGTTYTDVLQANTSTNTSTASVTGTTYTDVLQANTSVNTSIISVTNSVITNDVQANNTISAVTSLISNTITANISASIPTLTVSTKLDGNTATAFLNSLQVQGGGLTVNGNFTLTGSTVYAANTFQLSTGATSGISSYLQVARGSSGVNAAIRWSEPSLYWETLDVTGNIYSRIITENYLANQTGSSANSAFLKANSSYQSQNTTGTYANSAFLKANSAYDSQNTTGTYANSAFVKANSAYALANTFANTFVGTTGSISQSSGVISFSSNNGVTIVATAANNLAVSTSQDLRTTASPTFAGLTLTTPLGGGYGGTGTNNLGSGFQALIYGHIGTYGTSGQVLTTNGNGTYSWGTGAGAGGGTQPGTRIDSSRLSYTANGASGYTGNTFNIPYYTQANQVRVYTNGVRQFESEYSISAVSNTITFSTTPSSGDAILVEVDGYVTYAYYANNIGFTINSNISATANTIQLAIDGLTSKVTTYYSNLASLSTHTADVRGITMDAGTSNTSFATTAFAQYLANNSTYGVYTNGSYSNPSWISALANTKISGVMTASQLAATAVSTGTYGGATQHAVVTVDQQGRITYAANATPSIANSQITGVMTASQLAATAVSTGTYGGATQHAVVTVDQQGRITYAANATPSIANSQITGVMTASQLENTAVSAGSYGSASNVSRFTVDAQGRLTSANSVAIAIASGAVSGLATSATTDTTNASNISSGTLTAARLPYVMNQSVSTANNVQFNSLGVGTAGSGTTGEIRAFDNITAYYSSDRKFKEDIREIPDALNKVNFIGGKLFNWTDNYIKDHGGEDGYFIQKEDFGVIAQDVEAVFPIATRKKMDGTLAVDYEKLCALAFAAIKELKEEIDVLKGQNK